VVNAGAERSGSVVHISTGRRRGENFARRAIADLERRLNRIMAAVPIGEPGRKLRKRMAANRAHLFVFITNRDVPYPATSPSGIFAPASSSAR